MCLKNLSTTFLPILLRNLASEYHHSLTASGLTSIPIVCFRTFATFLKDKPLKYKTTAIAFTFACILFLFSIFLKHSSNFPTSPYLYFLIPYLGILPVVDVVLNKKLN